MNFGLKALACLLLYPDAALKDNLPEIKEGVGGSSLSDDQKDKLYIFINHLAETPLSDLQKDYVSTFDIGKKASLNLFEHMHGDSRERGSAMLNLKKLYEERGLSIESDEFPDYLPMFLEFLSGLGYSEAQALLDSAARHIAPIDIALQKSESPWRAVTGAILSLSAMKNSEIKLERDDLLPTTEAESFDSPVRFGGNADPVQTVHFKQAEDQKIFRETNFTPFLWIAPRRRFLSQRHHLVIEIIP